MITEDPQLASHEKETTMRINKQEEKIIIFSEIASMIRGLLKRDDFEVIEKRTVDGDTVAVKGKLPLGVLKIQQNERKHGKYANVVS